MFSNHLTCIHILLWEDKETSTVLQFIYRICKRSTRFHCYNRTIVATFNIAFPWLIFKETVSHNSLTRRCSQHIVSQTNNTARWNSKFHMNAVFLCLHRQEFTFSASYHIDNTARIFFWQIHCQLFYRFAERTIYLFCNNLWLTYLQFITLTAHSFNQHRQVQHTTSRHTPYIRIRIFLYSQCQVFIQLANQTVMYVARSHIFTIFTKEWRIIIRERHRHRWLINSNRVEWFWIFKVANRIPNLKILQTNYRTNIA